MQNDGKTFQERTLSPSFLLYSFHEYERIRTNQGISVQVVDFHCVLLVRGRCRMTVSQQHMKQRNGLRWSANNTMR
jgi:hypothetical protein